ncbi:hypothetical protein ACFPRL_07825 [Pseudoclavibacter helvolus]
MRKFEARKTVPPMRNQSTNARIQSFAPNGRASSVHRLASCSAGAVKCSS